MAAEEPESPTPAPLTTHSKDELYSESAKLSRETVKQRRPHRLMSHDEVIEDLGNQDTAFANLFLPPTRAAMWDVIMRLHEHPVTAAEFCSMGEKVSRSSFSRHKDVFLQWGVLAEAGSDEHGNQLYIKNVRHPLVQTMLMINRLAVHGSTPMLLEDQHVSERTSTERPPEAWAVERADSVSTKLVLCEKHGLDPEEWIDSEELEEYRQKWK